jgi:hypothetical protein
MPKPRNPASPHLGGAETGARDDHEGDPLDGVIDRALGRVRSYFDLEEEAERQARELLAVAGAESRSRLLRHGVPGFRNPALVEELLKRCRQSIGRDPEAARELAELAGEVAARVPATLFGERFRRDRLAEAHLHRSKALLAAGHRVGADAALDEAGRLADGSTDPFLWAELEELAADLAHDRRHWDEVAVRLAGAERFLTLCGAEPSVVVRLSLRRAAARFQGGDAPEAASLARECLERIDGEAHPELHLCARHNLAWYLCAAGRHGEAREIVRPEALPSVRMPPTVRLRGLWLEGRIALGLGEWRAAEAALAGVRDAFARRGCGYDAALAALDLAELYVVSERYDRLPRAAAWTSNLLGADDIHPDAFTALGLFRQAARSRTLSVPEIRRVARYLSEVRDRPAPRLQAAS